MTNRVSPPKKNKWLFLFILIFFVPVALLWANDNEAGISGKIYVLHASSLTEFFRQGRKKFSGKYSDISILLEPGASLVLIRKVKDLNKRADIIAVADETLFPFFLMPEHMEKADNFMAEEIVLIQGNNARRSNEISSENWYSIILREDVEFGVSNPDSAPIGYRTMMVWKLSEIFYEKPQLYERLRKGLKKRNIRQNAAALMVLLKAGEIDYAFNYKSLAIQHGLMFISLPPQINLGDTNFKNFYKKASVDIPGKKPGIKKRIQGTSIIYSMGILKDGENPKAAKAFIKFLLGPDGLSIMKKLGTTPLYSQKK